MMRVIGLTALTLAMLMMSPLFRRSAAAAVQPVVAIDAPVCPAVVVIVGVPPSGPMVWVQTFWVSYQSQPSVAFAITPLSYWLEIFAWGLKRPCSAGTIAALVLG